MYYQSVINDKYILSSINEDTERETLLKALNLLDNSLYEGHTILSNLITLNNSNALMLSSMYSKEEETKNEYIQRHLKLIYNASKVNNPLALYTLGVYYDLGKYYQEDKNKAKEYFQKAAEKNMPQAMTIYGIMLYYGTGGAILDRKNGLRMIEDALSFGEDSAKEFLEYLNS